MTLHDLYFGNLGGDGTPGGAISQPLLVMDMYELARKAAAILRG